VKKKKKRKEEERQQREYAKYHPRGTSQRSSTSTSGTRSRDDDYASKYESEKRRRLESGTYTSSSTSRSHHTQGSTGISNDYSNSVAYLPPSSSHQVPTYDRNALPGYSYTDSRSSTRVSTTTGTTNPISAYYSQRLPWTQH